MGDHNVNDLSIFMLFEATGDSETDISDSKMETMELEAEDAESCCDFIDFENCYDEENEVFSRNNFFGEEYDDDDGDEVMSYFGNKPRICFESEVEFLDEREKSRLFWEACLADS